MNIQAEVSLKNKNTLAIDATAEFYAKPSSLDELEEVRLFAKENDLVVKVLGGGSNVVMAERISGLVVSYLNTECRVVNQNDDWVVVEVGGGFVWHDFVMYSLSQGWFGLENLALIPGTVGAAPVQNIGAYGVEVEQFIESVSGVVLETGEHFRYDAQQCAFAYRESIFKHRLDGKVLITSVCFKLAKQPSVKLNYAPLADMAVERGVPTPEVLAQWVIEVRQSKLPDPSVLPNAGSFFKNPVISTKHFERLKERFGDMPNYTHSDGVKVPAGWLIDRMGYKGKVLADGCVSVHKKQALVLVNHNGSGQQVRDAAKHIQAQVKDVYGIDLEQEPRLFC